MRKAVAAVVTFAVLTFAGCKSQEQKHADLSAEYQTANAQYQKDCSVTTSDQDANAIIDGAFGNKPSPQQQAAIDQRQREAVARKNSPNCKELDAKRDDLTKQILTPPNR